MLLVIVVQKALKLELQALARGGQEGGSSPVLLPAGFWLPPALAPAPSREGSEPRASLGNKHSSVQTKESCVWG